MLEIPEAKTIATQIGKLFKGITIENVIANYSPHKFAWYYGEPENYGNLLIGKTIDNTESLGGYVKIYADDTRILLQDGANARYFGKDDKLPKKHQLLIKFENGDHLIVTVQMYGGIFAFNKGEFDDNEYYDVAKEKPQVFDDEFSLDYFKSLYDEDSPKLSLKAFLATKQRIPGLGNGILQDILFNAGMHPKRLMKNLSDEDFDRLFYSVKSTIKEMTDKGGRDIEKDLFNNQGGYTTILSRNTVNKPCKVCGTVIEKKAYLGGAIYYCGKCQIL